MKNLLTVVLVFLCISGFAQTVIVPTGATTIYDLQSNSTPVQIIQDKNNFSNIHSIFLSSAYSDTAFAQRKLVYYFSSDNGSAWSNASPSVSSSLRGGFGSISLLNTGAALISMNINFSGNTQRTNTFVDAFPGLGSFTDLGTTPCTGLWPDCIASLNTSQTQKYYIINSSGFTTGLSLVTPSYTSCSNFQPQPQNNYSIAIGKDGRIGIAYIVDESVTPSDAGDVYFTQSFDNGQTFSQPLKIYDAVINIDNTFLGALRGISLVYTGNTPNVVFELVKRNTSGVYFTEVPGGIRYWSSIFTGSDPNRSKYIARNDSAGFSGYIPFYKSFNKDVITSICRPSIGSFSDTNFMAVVFMTSTPNIKTNGTDTASYNDIYLTWSKNRGASWRTPFKINPSSPLRDWSYPSISKFNQASGSLYYYANITATRDSIPGSYVNTPSLGKSLAEQMFIKAEMFIDTPPVTTTTTSGTIRYNDNNQLVTNGTVKALRFDESTGQVITTTTSPIDANGNYSLTFDIPYSLHYIVAYPNSEPQADYIPTYYPQSINWQAASTINSANNNSSINIGVFRKTSISGSYSVSGFVNKITNTQLTVLPQASLYIKSGSSYVGFAESNNLGRYNLNSLPNGSYEVFATKLGYSNSTRNIIVNTANMDSVNFAVYQILIGIQNYSDLIPKEYNLYQNYPNPFNPVTNIKFDLPKSGFASLKIYDVLGKEVAVLLNEVKQAGSYKADFNAANLPSGIYFYKLSAGEFTETRRMMLIK